MHTLLFLNFLSYLVNPVNPVNPVIYMDVVVENCSYIFDTSAIAQGMCRCREAHGSARATIAQGSAGAA